MTCALVTITPLRATQPGSFVAVAAAVPRTRTVDCVALLDFGVPRDRGVRRGDVRRRAVDLRDRVDPGERVKDPAGGRQGGVDLTDDGGGADRLAELLVGA